MSGLVIEDGVPLPPRKYSPGRPSVLCDTLKSTRAGQSVFVAGKTTRNIGGFFSNVRKTQPDAKFASRPASENGAPGVRIWRLE